LTTSWQMEATAGSLFASPVHTVRVLASKLASQPKESRQIAGPRHERIDAGMMPRLLTTQRTPDIDLSALPLDRIDVSDPRLYQHDCWHPLFERLCKESPVHYCAESAVWTLLVAVQVQGYRRMRDGHPDGFKCLQWRTDRR
jgi:hypothetical protein